MRTHRLINVPTANAADIKIGFLERPDGDNVQENQLQHLNDKIYQTTGIPNLSDSNFAGNASGVAIRYKLLAMENKASNKERKFTQALRALYKVVFSIDSVINVSDAWEDLKFKFTRNLPANLADEASTANSLNGIVSKETQLGALSIVDDPKAEMERMEEEQDQQLKKSLEVTGADYEKLDDTNQEQPEANQKSIKSPFSNEEVDND
ncbi:phage portal protein [Lactobacillus iners]|nr:phage portal protein [Lactobacillus iners]MDK8317610.1 phage portal protein [Lactobacillus iners]MDK8324381.1 phage portal protein [Lactobacillus iners]MDK8582024.1 phage portal protein [Lactobacillus iners]MDX5070533.1 phage portal protein [Lactobacillus iners]MDX5084479.1 phage portal protein [Lactobacillus iners]